MVRLLYLVFILSGAAGLMYESIWSRYLGLFVGHSAYAQIIVLVIFLGGMSLGAAAAGRRSERVASPLAWYAGIELLVGVIGLFFHEVFVGVTGLAYDALFPAVGSGALLTTLKWTIAALLILPQSVLLGATFPLMSAGVLRLVGDGPGERGYEGSGRVLALLYFANSFGAAVGVLLAGFWLIGLAGLPGTLVAAAVLNFVVALVVVVMARGGRGVDNTANGERRTANGSDLGTPLTADPSAVRRSPFAGPSGLPRLSRALLVVAFGTAVASFIYEIGWIRMLSLVLGGATHSFELMLSAFILGLSLGALWIRRHADRLASPLAVLGFVQVAMGVLAIMSLPLYLASFDWLASLLAAVRPTEPGYRLFTFAKYAVCLAVMLPATFCAGMTLPLITRTLLAAGGGERAIGQVYAVNTLGSILGAALAGLVLMPLVGLKGLLVIGAVTDMAFGLWLLAGAADGVRHTGMLRRAAGLSLLATGAVLLGVDLDRNRLTSGVFRYGQAERNASWKVLYYLDGRTATVSGTVDTRNAIRTLATNGKPDASLTESWLRPWDSTRTRRLALSGDQTAQVLLPLITLAHAPEARSAANVGQGSGTSGHLLLGSPHLRRLTTIEIEPGMIEGSRIFYPANRRVFDDRRSRFVIDDAKSVFTAGGEKFDLILSEPSNPWVSGVSGLFTEEFYQRVKASLAEGGVFGQWMHLYETEDRLVLSVLGAIHRVFPTYAVYAASGADILIVATNGPRLRAPDWSVLRYPAIAADFARVVPLDPWVLDATKIADERVLGPLAAIGGVNSDYYPTLDLGAERARFLRSSAGGFMSLASARFDVAAALAETRRPFSPVSRLAVDIDRVIGLALSARVREAIATGRFDSLGTGAERKVLDEGRYEWQRVSSLMRAGTEPESWPMFVADMVRLEEKTHDGSAGVAWEPFYSSVRGYLARTAPPPSAVAAIDFLEGAARWDWPRVRDAGKVLLSDGSDTQWIPASFLRAALVVALLKTGDVDGARAALERLTVRVPGEGIDARTLLLEAHVAAAERASGVRTPARTPVASGASR